MRQDVLFLSMRFSYLRAMKRVFLTILIAPLVMIVAAQSQSQWTDRAFTYLAQDSLPQAEECFRKAVEGASNNTQKAMLLGNLGLVQRQRGKVHDAVESYTQALEWAPMDAGLLMHRATAYMVLGNDDRAYTDLCNVLDRVPDNSEALYYRAFIYTNRREYAAARADYKYLLSKDPSHEHALLGLALLDQREGRLQAAVQQLTILIERYPDNPTYLQARANVFVEQGLYDLALIDLDTAIGLHEEDAHLYVARAEVYIKMKRRTTAKSDLDRAVRLGLPRVALHELYQQCDAK